MIGATLAYGTSRPSLAARDGAPVSAALAILATLIATAFVFWIGVNLATAEKRLLYRPRRLYTSHDPDFRRALGILLGPPLVSGNHVKTLINGDRIFPPMLAAIRAAKVSITFETFVFRDQIGCEFCEALSAAAKRGVNVCILLDWLGSRGMDAKLLDATREAGCDLQIYHPPTWFHLGRLNNRTHRKLLIVDGKTGFTGGVGMGNEWLGDAQDKSHWRETHYQVEGPVVAQMQAVFVDNWIKSTGRVLHGPEFFPLRTRHRAIWMPRCLEARRWAARRACISWSCWLSLQPRNRSISRMPTSCPTS